MLKGLILVGTATTTATMRQREIHILIVEHAPRHGADHVDDFNTFNTWCLNIDIYKLLPLDFLNLIKTVYTTTNKRFGNNDIFSLLYAKNLLYGTDMESSSAHKTAQMTLRQELRTHHSNKNPVNQSVNSTA